MEGAPRRPLVVAERVPWPGAPGAPPPGGARLVLPDEAGGCVHFVDGRCVATAPLPPGNGDGDGERARTFVATRGPDVTAAARVPAAAADGGGRAVALKRLGAAALEFVGYGGGGGGHFVEAPRAAGAPLLGAVWAPAPAPGGAAALVMVTAAGLELFSLPPPPPSPPASPAGGAAGAGGGAAGASPARGSPERLGVDRGGALRPEGALRLDGARWYSYTPSCRLLLVGAGRSGARVHPFLFLEARAAAGEGSLGGSSAGGRDAGRPLEMADVAVRLPVLDLAPPWGSPVKARRAPSPFGAAGATPPPSPPPPPSPSPSTRGLGEAVLSPAGAPPLAAGPATVWGAALYGRLYVCHHDRDARALRVYRAFRDAVALRHEVALPPAADAGVALSVVDSVLVVHLLGAGAGDALLVDVGEGAGGGGGGGGPPPALQPLAPPAPLALGAAAGGGAGEVLLLDPDMALAAGPGGAPALLRLRLDLAAVAEASGARGAARAVAFLLRRGGGGLAEPAAVAERAVRALVAGGPAGCGGDAHAWLAELRAAFAAAAAGGAPALGPAALAAAAPALPALQAHAAAEALVSSWEAAGLGDGVPPDTAAALFGSAAAALGAHGARAAARAHPAAAAALPRARLRALGAL